MYVAHKPLTIYRLTLYRKCLPTTVPEAGKGWRRLIQWRPFIWTLMVNKGVIAFLGDSSLFCGTVTAGCVAFLELPTRYQWWPHTFPSTPWEEWYHSSGCKSLIQELGDIKNAVLRFPPLSFPLRETDLGFGASWHNDQPWCERECE